MKQNLFTAMHDQYNARHLNADQIARYFVKSAQYELLAKSRNSVIAGPRGSGKTTLLKMLCQEPLELWPDRSGGNFREKITFTGVFIYTDVSWSELFNSIEQSTIDPKISRAIISAIITTRILSSFAETLSSKISGKNHDGARHRRIEVSIEQELKIVTEISSAWLVEPEIASIRGLKVAVDNRLRNIGMLRQKLNRGVQIREQELPSYFDLDYSQAISSAIDSCNYHTQVDEKWALLFDEMEFAPDWFLDKLYIQIRANDPKFFIKLAVSPLRRTSFMNEALSPLAGHDFDTIALWYTQGSESKDFCDKLWNSLLERRELDYIDPSMILDDSEYNSLKSQLFKPALSNSRSKLTLTSKSDLILNILTNYEKKDSSFRSYLKGKNTTVYDLVNAKSEAERGSGLRKILPVVLFRDHYFRQNSNAESPSSKRSRKTLSPMYAGWEMISQLSEGNPRWFLAVATSLLDQSYSIRGDVVKYKKLTINQQSKVLQRAGEAQHAMFRVHPMKNLPELNMELGIIDLVDEIGKQFRQVNLGPKFRTDLLGSFIVDLNLSKAFYELVEDALIAGAIVYIPAADESEVGFGDINGKRFRLNYLLAPRYGILPRLGKPVYLSKLLENLSPSNGEQKELPLGGKSN